MSKNVIVQIDGAKAKSRLPGDFFVKKTKVSEGIIVDLQGIRHIIVESSLRQDSRKIIERYKEGMPAVGVMAVENHNTHLAIHPLVWVRATNTYIPETACGSGSIAAALACHFSSSSIPILQPSQEYFTVQLELAGGILQAIFLAGLVKYLGEAEAIIG